MIRKCAWCGEFLGTVPDNQHDEDDVTHGICDDCMDREEEKYLKKRQAEKTTENSN